VWIELFEDGGKLILKWGDEKRGAMDPALGDVNSAAAVGNST
jgi:hypothetical protein